MRTKNSVNNAITAIILNSTRIILGFIFQKVFIMKLGVEYLGLNSLLGNVISMISVAELGIGTAIIYNLYKPIHDNDTEKIKSLVLFYKKCYRIIILVISILAIISLPMLKYIVGNTTITNIELYYLLFLVDSMLTYSVAHLTSLFCADQKNYFVNLIETAYLLFMNILQIIFLFVLKNYFVFILIKIISRILQNILIYILANKKYSYIKEKDVMPIDKITLNDIKKKVKAMIIHKFSTFIIVSTDSIIITKFLGLVVSGLYSNYKLIINSISNLFLQIFNSITSSVGNLLISKDKDYYYLTYKKLLLLNFWIFGFSSVTIYYLIEPFISLIYGSQYLLSNFVLIVLVIYFYLHGMRGCISSFKEAAGIYYEDRFMPVIESIINIVFSIIFVKIMGLAGVFIGTILSVLFLHIYSYPKFVYSKLFDRKKTYYIYEQIKYFLIAICSVILTGVFINIFEFNNLFLQLIYNFMVCVVVSNGLYYIIFHKTKEFNSLKEITINYAKKLKK